MDGWDTQPFFVLNDVAYGRMLDKLKSGSPYEKSYAHTCPHRDPSNCKCKYHVNFLYKCRCTNSECQFENDYIVRCVNGKLKPVLPEREYAERFAKK